MFFVINFVCVPSPMLAAEDRGLRHCVPVGSAAVARDAKASVPVDGSTLTAAYEVSVSSGSRFPASAGPRFAERRGPRRSLRHGLDPFVFPRLPRPPTRGRCHGISELNQG